MRRVLWIAAMVLLAYLGARSALHGCSGSLPKPGTPAPAWRASDAAGRGMWSAASFANRPYALLFFATWCGACSRELPDVERWVRENPNLGVVLVTDEPQDVIQGYLKRRNLNLPVAVSAGLVLRQFGVSVLPSAVVMDAAGNVEAASQGVGAMGRMLRRLLRSGDG